jgi:Ca2+-binding EF-hand superfamily protein
VNEVAGKFDTWLRTLVSANDAEEAARLQNATDLLMEEITALLRAENMEHCTLVERARRGYAAVFTIYQRTADNSRLELLDRKAKVTELEESLTRLIGESDAKVKEIQAECHRQLDEKQREMDEKKEEYDNSMKRFLEEKAHMSSHLDALHRIFKVFQADSVYLTLEELKQKIQNLEKKLRHKEDGVSKLNGIITKIQKAAQDSEAERTNLKQANDDLRRQLQAALATTKRLQRRLEMQDIDAGGDFQDIDIGEETQHAEGSTTAPVPSGDAPLISSEAVHNSTEVPKFANRARNYQSGVDAGPYFSVLQKLGQVTDRIANVLQSSSANVMLPGSSTDETDKIMLSGSPQLMIRAIQMKTSEVLQYAECLDGVDFNVTRGEGAAAAVSAAALPRFLQYINAHNQGASGAKGSTKVTNAAFLTVRQIFNAKYLSDRINGRMGHRNMRFPEFVIAYFTRDEENLFTGLSRSARLWRLIEGSKAPELKMFRHFLLEKLTMDELSFFVEARHSLLGQRNYTEDDSPSISIPYARCQEFLASVLGTFSPVLAAVSIEAEKHAPGGYIDYATFLNVLTTYYQNERKRRRNAVRLMFQSKNLAKGEFLDFENFVTMIQSLGFTGSTSDIFTLFRESNLLGGGSMTLESFLRAMDSLAFHFYSIQVPMSMTKTLEMTKLTRQQMMQHWVRFGSWFGAFRQPIPSFDPWLRSEIIAHVRKVDRAFKENQKVPVLCTEFRQLLDFFQFALDVAARSQTEPMSQQKSERHLVLLENIVDLLVTFVVKDCGGDLLFSEVT